MSLASGTKLGPYEIVSPLGAGGMGEVYKARDPKLERMVAIKVLPEHMAKDADALARFEREAKALAALQHPNVLGIFDFGSDLGITYAVMELLEGETLRESITRGALPPRRAVEITAQMAQGLAAAHSKGIIHRDLKPENIFLMKDGRVRILDFGLAKKIEPVGVDAPTVAMDSGSTEPGMLLGTVGYMAPEQVRGEGADARSDIFAFGCVLFELLTGQRAFRGSSAVETMNAILKEDPPGLDAEDAELPPDLRRILVHCLEKDPSRRFQSAQDLGFALESGSSTTKLKALQEALPPRRLNPWALLGAGALVLLLGGWAISRTLAGPAPPVIFQRIGSSEGLNWNARFAPDGLSVIYSARVGNGSRVSEFHLARNEDRVLTVIAEADLAAVSPKGELAVLLNPRQIPPAQFRREGVLAQAPLGGGAPRPLAEHVQWAEFGPPGTDLIRVSEGPDGGWIEWPAGKVLFKAAGFVSHPRLAPDTHRLAFIHHPIPNDSQGQVKVLDLSTGKTESIGPAWSTIWGLAWHPNGEIWVSAGEKIALRGLCALDTRGRSRLIINLPQSATLYDITPSGRVLMDSMYGHRGVGVEQIGGGFKEAGISPRCVLSDLSAKGDQVLFTERERSPGPDYPVFLRPSIGGSPLALGMAQSGRLSPDGTQVALWAEGDPSHLQILPTRLGEKRSLPLSLQPGEVFKEAQWWPDGQSLLLVTKPAGAACRAYRWDLAKSTRQALDLPGLGDASHILISSDGGYLIAPTGANTWRRFKLESLRGIPQESFAVPAPFTVLGCDSGGLALHLAEGEFKSFPVRLMRLRAGGEPEPWLILRGPDSRSLIEAIRKSADDRTFALGYFRMETTLFVVDGLR